MEKLRSKKRRQRKSKNGAGNVNKLKHNKAGGRGRGWERRLLLVEFLGIFTVRKSESSAGKEREGQGEKEREVQATTIAVE